MSSKRLKEAIVAYFTYLSSNKSKVAFLKHCYLHKNDALPPYGLHLKNSYRLFSI
jgi:hypothetical protein